MICRLEEAGDRIGRLPSQRHGRKEEAVRRVRVAGPTKGPGPSRPDEANRVVASNRRARHDYDILETSECGIVLQGSEVKSLRAGRIALQDAYARIIDGEMWLFGVHVPPYAQANGFGAHDPDRQAQAPSPPPADRRVDGARPNSSR